MIFNTPEGEGIALDQMFDFEVDTTGDIAAVSGKEELQKDLAFQMAFSLRQYLGEPPSPNLFAEVSTTAARVARRDPRVESVDSENIDVSLSTDDEYRIVVRVPVQTANQENYEFVFTETQ